MSRDCSRNCGNNCCGNNSCNCRNTCCCVSNSCCRSDCFCNCRNTCCCVNNSCCGNDCFCNRRNDRFCNCRNASCCENIFPCFRNTGFSNFRKDISRESRLQFDTKPQKKIVNEQESDTDKESVDKINRIKFYKNLLLTGVCGLEFLNQKYDPFNFDLKDWSKNVALHIDNYANVLDKIYEKYKHVKPKELSPECKLILQVITDGIIHHLSGQLFGNKNPIDLSMFMKNKNNPLAFVDKNGTVHPSL